MPGETAGPTGPVFVPLLVHDCTLPVLINSYHTRKIDRCGATEIAPPLEWIPRCGGNFDDGKRRHHANSRTPSHRAAPFVSQPDPIATTFRVAGSVRNRQVV